MNTATLLAAFFLAAVVPQSEPVPPEYAAAKAALDAQDPALAARIIEESLAALPPGTEGSALLQLTLGTAYLRAGQPEKAVAPLEKAAVRDPAAVAPLADALRGAGRAEEARGAYEKAVAADAANARYSRARIAQLDSAAEKDPQKSAAFLFTAADTFAEDTGYFDEATALYETIARTKAWRGESTARALFSLGEIQRLRKAYPEAIAYYQRCFVSWARYPQWCARAYHRAADSFEALGRRPEAISHLREMLRKSDKYGRLPEFNEAKTRLRAWGEVVQ